MIGKNNVEKINGIAEAALHLSLNEAYKTPTNKEHLLLMRQLMLGAANLLGPLLELNTPMTYDNTIDFLRKQACGTDEYSYYQHDLEYCFKREIFSYYTYVGPQSNDYTFDFDITHLKKQYVWFIEKYLIPQEIAIRDKTILYFSVNRPLTNEEMAQKQLSKTLELYIQTAGELYAKVQGRNGIDKRLKKCDIFDLSCPTWRNNPKNRSDTIRLKSYLVYLEQKYDIRITDVLKKHNIRHTIYVDKAYNLGDLYAKMLYDISLALDFDFLVDAHNFIINSENVWTNCLCNVFNLLMDLSPIDVKVFCQQLYYILSTSDKSVDNNYSEQLTVLEGFYTMLLYSDRAYFYEGILSIEKRISELPDTVFSQKLTDPSLKTPIANAKSEDFAAVKNYIMTEHLSIRDFVFSEKSDRKLKKKWVKDNTSAVINILKILDAHSQLTEITPYLIYICFKFYNECDQSVRISAIYDANYRLCSTKHDISNYKSNIVNQLYLLNRLNKYIADHDGRSEQFKYNNDISMMFHRAISRCFEINNPRGVAQHTERYTNQINALINLYRQNGLCHNEHLPMWSCNNTPDDENIKVSLSRDDDKKVITISGFKPNI